MKTAQVLVLAIHALIGWALCGAIMGIGRAVTTLDNTLIIHAVATPIVFALISWIYHTRFGNTAPLQTALIFVGIVVGMDAFLVAPVFEKSFEMFTSLIGTWVPFALIFLSTYLTGLVCEKKRQSG
ncbi:MAG: hypothetical protein FJ009_12525 [Chloroflexi bacterium]|nr:hypothetical protein [Chloroflexota bacterium]